jgi:uncharacterized integral membrane protein
MLSFTIKTVTVPLVAVAVVVIATGTLIVGFAGFLNSFDIKPRE